MFHFLKYFFVTLSFFFLLNLFRSNQEVTLPLKFQVPLLGEWLTPPVPIFYLVILAFCGGMILSAFVGSLRIEKVRAEKKEIKLLKKDLHTLKNNQGAQQTTEGPQENSSSNPLPPLA